jgi:hypothetical protein
MEVSTELHDPAALRPFTLSILDWVGPTAGLDTMEWRITSYFCRESSSGCPALIPSLYQVNYDYKIFMRRIGYSELSHSRH